VEHPTIALIEDDSATITVITDMLVDEGFQTFQWRQGRGAFELIKEQQPNAIILDIRLEHPRAGSEVLTMLRDDPTTRDIPVIICTGDTEFLAENQARLRAQHDEIIQKPFKLDALLSKIQRVLDRTARPGANGRTKQASPPSTMATNGEMAPIAPLIALVDSGPDGVTRLTERLSISGYAVAPLRWGHGVYETIRRERPAMVVIEIEQADRRVAWLTLNRLQHNANTRTIPILLCSSDASFLATQARRYLVMQKPLEARNLLSLIEQTVGPPPAKPTASRSERRRAG
jgi:CheY-like chemotaxis protein